MPSLLDTLTKGLTSQDTLKSHQHAARIFVDGKFRLSPKYSFLFYIQFHYADRYAGLRTKVATGLQLGALAKSASLPKFTIDNQVVNTYNRAHIVQKKLKYDPVTIKFHDDSMDVVREFWYDYMTFYYRDSEYDPSLYSQAHKYVDRTKDAWGYNLRHEWNDPAEQSTGLGAGSDGGSDYNPLQAISIFSLTQHKFSQYMLINPKITSFRHGEHTNEGSSLLENEMTIAYETVKYYKGVVNQASFGDSMLLLYDKMPSPLQTGVTASIFGAGGLVDTFNNVEQDIANGNFAAAALKLAKAKQAFSGTSVGQVLTSEGLGMIQQSIQTGTNPLSTVNAPAIGDLTNKIIQTPGGGPALVLGGGLAIAGAVGMFNNQQPAAGNQNTVGTNTTAPRVADGVAPVNYQATSGNEYVSAVKVEQPVETFPTLTQAENQAQLSDQYLREYTSLPVTDYSPAEGGIPTLNEASSLITAASQGKQTNG